MRMRNWYKSALCGVLGCAVLLSGCKEEVYNTEEKGYNTEEEVYNTKEAEYNTENVRQVASSVLPVMASYPGDDEYRDENGEKTENAKKWSEQRDTRRNAIKELSKYQDSLQGFYGKTIDAFLTDNGNENAVFSPVNLYFALAMAAEITEGESRSQILELLGAENIETLRKQTESLWTAGYRNDGATTSVLANSLWLKGDLNYNESTVDTLAEKYFASVFQGDTASKDMTNALRNWINEQTGGLLKDSVDNLELDARTVAAICSTVYFRAKWDTVFSKNNNDHKTFHGSRGDVEKEFMNQTYTYGPYYCGEDFGAVYIRFAEGGGMWLILPDEDKSVSDVLRSGEYLEMIGDPYQWENSVSVKVNCSVPKFDVASDIGLADGLKRLSVTDVFDIEKSDFTPLTEDTGVYFTDVRHAARVTIDEEGCTAAAYTAMLAAGAALPPEDEVDFVVDRPFVFAVMGDCKQPLFVGTVYDL